MADLTITTTLVVAGPGASVAQGWAADTITAGQAVQISAGRYSLSDADGIALATRRVDGIALNAASAGQPLYVQRAGPIVLGAVLVPGADYYLSATAGRICRAHDLADGDEVVLLGLAASTSVLLVCIVTPGVQIDGDNLPPGPGFLRNNQAGYVLNASGGRILVGAS